MTLQRVLVLSCCSFLFACAPSVPDSNSRPSELSSPSAKDPSGSSAGCVPTDDPSDPPPAAMPCGTVTTAGVCDGDSVVYCSDLTNTLDHEDCGNLGGCVVGSDGWANCAEHP